MHIPDDEFDDALSDLENLQARGVDVGAALRRLLNHAPRRPTLPRSSTSAAPQQPRVVPHVQAHIVHNVRASTTLNPSATPLDAATATPPPLAVTPTPLLAATFSASTPAPFAAGTLQERVNSGRARSLPPSLSQQRMLPFQPTLCTPKANLTCATADLILPSALSYSFHPSAIIFRHADTFQHVRADALQPVNTLERVNAHGGWRVPDKPERVPGERYVSS